MRCSTPRNVRSTGAINAGATPIAPAIVTAASAFSRLCGPGMNTSSARQIAFSPSPRFSTIMPSLTHTPQDTSCVRENQAIFAARPFAISWQVGSS